MRVIIDRFEGEYAVVLTEEKKSIAVPAVLFEGGQEGDVFDIVKNTDETEKRKDRIEKLAKELWK